MVNVIVLATTCLSVTPVMVNWPNTVAGKRAHAPNKAMKSLSVVIGETLHQ